MENISLNGEPLKVDSGCIYVIIDALYLNDIKAALPDTKDSQSLSELRRSVFQHTETPFSERKFDFDILSIDRIKKVLNHDLHKSKHIYFSSDTGLVVVIKKEILFLFIKDYNYEQLVDDAVQPVSIDYWRSVVKALKATDVGLILAPGVESGYEFDGSGTYEIV